MNSMMNKLRTYARPLVSSQFSKLVKINSCPFGDIFKEKEIGAEKTYINQEESKNKSHN